MTPSRLPYRVKRIAVRVEARRIDDTRRNDETCRGDETMRRDETRQNRNGLGRPYLQTGMTPHSASEYGTRHRNDTLDAGNS